MGSAVGDGDAVGAALSLAEADGDGDLVGVAFRSGGGVVAGEVVRVGSGLAEDGVVGWVVLPAVADVSGSPNQAYAAKATRKTAVRIQVEVRTRRSCRSHVSGRISRPRSGWPRAGRRRPG